MKRYINFKAITIILSCILVFVSCEKEDEPVALTLSESSLEIYAGDNGSATIETGNGGYSASSSNELVATVSISGSSITITAIAKGSATITVSDQAGKSVTIAITVNSALISTDRKRFNWDGVTIELNTANGWGNTILSDRVAVTNLSEETQYVLTWTGGFTVGDKTSATLKIAKDKETTEEITLNELEVQSEEEGVYSVIFSTSTTSGELVFENK